MCHPDDHVEPAPDVALADWSATEAPLGGIVASPVGEPEGTIVLIPDITGVSAFYRGLASQLAGAGFTTIVPDLYSEFDPIAEGDRQAALDRQVKLDQREALRRVDGVIRELTGTGARVGLVGFCFGGTLVLDLAAEGHDVATVCFYGFPGAPPIASMQTVPPPLELVPRLRGPILGLWGAEDTTAGIDNVDALREQLVHHAVEHEIVVYPGLGHSFLRLAFASDGASPEQQELASDAWTRTMGFLRAHLVAGAGT